MRDIEDEVDWGDTPLEGSSAYDDGGFGCTLTADDPKSPQSEADGTTDQSSPEFVLPRHLQDIIDGRYVQPTTKAPKDRTVRSERRDEINALLTAFALYQANQKVYEAMFVKRFTAHALAPATLAACTEQGDDPTLMQKIATYLQSVAANIDQITDKMIWNAHAKSVNFLTSDDRPSLPFINTDSFKKDLFNLFGPTNPSSVIRQLHPSWHRVYKQSGMVQYSARDYPVEAASGHASLNELQDASLTIHFSSSSKVSFPKGRVYKDPSSLSTRFLAPHRDALKVTPLKPAAKPPQQVIQTVQDYSRLYGQDLSLLEAFVARPLRQSQQLNDYEEQQVAPTKPPAKVVPQWKIKVLRDHKQRLARRCIRSRPPVSLPKDLASVISRAVSMGILQPPSVQTQHILAAYDIKRKELLVRSNARKRAAKKAIGQGSQMRKPAASVVGTAVHQAQRQVLTRKPRKVLQAASAGSSKMVNPSRKRKNPSLLTERPTKRPRKSINNRRDRHAKRARNAQAREDDGQHKPSRGHGRSEVILKLAPTVSPPHPSGSKTLEPHQHLPPTAYFEKKEEDEDLAWRCGAQHACGHYYNAGNRKSCRGCNTNIKHNNHTQLMDFYMPPDTWYKQPAPEMATWKPTKLKETPNKAPSSSHNAIAKVKFWEAIRNGATETEARYVGIAAVEEHLRPKPKPVRPRTPTPTPEPEPIDLGPHPSGSTTMEHGLDLPECAYFEKKEDDEKFAWRCDSGHALGRYYIAGDKRTCPGCGSSIDGKQRKATMDFYMPSGSVVRQGAKGLVDFVPRKFYRVKKDGKNRGKSSKKHKQLTHNQLVTEKYWPYMVRFGNEEKALEQACEDVDAELDAKLNAAADISKKAFGANKKATGTGRRGKTPESDIYSEDESDEDEGSGPGGTSEGAVLSLSQGYATGGKTPGRGQVIYRDEEVIEDSDDESDVPSSGSDSE